MKLLRWDVIVHPMLRFTNCLPCDIILQIIQPPHPALQQNIRKPGISADGARDLFYLPTEFYAKSSQTMSELNSKVEEFEGWKPFQNTSRDNFSDSNVDGCIYNGIVTSGRLVELSYVDTNKTIYFRLSVPGTSFWSKPSMMSSSILQNKVLFNRHGEEVIEWELSRY